MRARKTFSVTTARNQFGALLDEIEVGRAIVITRHGRAVAELVPIGRSPSPVPPTDIVAAFRRLRKGRRLGISIKQTVGEGRRR